MGDELKFARETRFRECDKRVSGVSLKNARTSDADVVGGREVSCDVQYNQEALIISGTNKHHAFPFQGEGAARCEISFKRSTHVESSIRR